MDRPIGFLSGLLVNVGDDRIPRVSAGECMMNDESIVRVTDELTWTKGTGDGIFRLFNVYLIARPRWQRWLFFWLQQVSILYSASPFSPVMPKGFTRFRMIGAVFPDGVGGIRQYSSGPDFLRSQEIENGSK